MFHLVMLTTGFNDPSVNLNSLPKRVWVPITTCTMRSTPKDITPVSEGAPFASRFLILTAAVTVAAKPVAVM